MCVNQIGVSSILCSLSRSPRNSSDAVSGNYHKEYNDTSPVFQQMLDSKYPLRVLIYNGDVDTACSMFEAEWFIEGFAKSNQMVSARQAS